MPHSSSTPPKKEGSPWYRGPLCDKHLMYGRSSCRHMVCRLSPTRWSTIRSFSRSPGFRSFYSRAFPSSDSGLLRFRRGHSSGAAPAFYRIPLTEIPWRYSVVSKFYPMSGAMSSKDICIWIGRCIISNPVKFSLSLLIKICQKVSSNIFFIAFKERS